MSRIYFVSRPVNFLGAETGFGHLALIFEDEYGNAFQIEGRGLTKLTTFEVTFIAASGGLMQAIQTSRRAGEILLTLFDRFRKSDAETI